MKIAVVGATGMVGNVMLQVLAEQKLEMSELILAASPRSVGKTLEFNNENITVVSVEDALSASPDIVIFSAGGRLSREMAPQFAAMGSTVIDNSSAWRMDEKVPLIVPEINAGILTAEDKIIANPNCSTIQMVVALNKLHEAYKIDRLVISTYQSVTGTGVKAVEQLMAERKNGSAENGVYPHPIDMNCLPHGGDFLVNGYTTEEMKLVHETRKIFNDYTLRISSTVVRVPVLGGHSEAVNVSFHQPFDMKDVMQLLANSPGVTIQDDPLNNAYPMPLFAEGMDDVFVGRIRRDESHVNALNMWIVSDNLRKGAATNAVQIAEYISSNSFI